MLVTGAAGGFGRAIARRFAGEGARLVLSDLDTGCLQEVAEACGSECALHAGDVAEPATARALTALALDRFGSLDVAVNNAGIAHPLKRLAEIDDAEAAHVIGVNLTAVFLAMKHQIAAMERQFAESGRRGAIVNLASIAGVIGAPGLSAYAAAKHGVVGLTKTAALESARRGVRVNAVCPSYTVTPMLTGTIMTGEGGMDAERLSRGIPMGRLATIVDVVEAVLFAAAPENAFMTGQTLHVDGGLSAG